MNRAFFIFLLSIIFTNFCHAFDLDMTVDDEIRKNYNSSKLMEDTNTLDENLPDLPAILEGNSTYNNANKNTIKSPVKEILNENFNISKGTTFNVINSTKINDWLAKGNTIKFYTPTSIKHKNYTIPANTEFYGKIIEVHQPQISGNGGLVVIRLSSMVYKGNSFPINAYVTRANEKKIFLNNIKGKRTYLKTMWEKGNWGRTLFGRMLTLTINLGGEGSTILLSPFPFAYGTICLGINAITSPICAFFTKGGHVSIPSGSKFKIRFLNKVNVH